MKGLALGSKAATRGTLLVARSRRSSAAAAPRVSALEVSCKAKQGQELNGKWCRITGKTANNGYSVSHSHVRTKRLQHVNLHVKRVYWPRGNRWVKLRLSAKGMKTVEKNGIEAAAKQAGIDLWKLPFQLDESEARKQWKKQQKEDGNVQLHGRVLPKDKRKMVNLEKLAKSDHPLAAECNALLSKLTLTGDAKEDSKLLNLRKLSESDHELAREAKDVLDRSMQLGPVLSEKHRQKKYAEAHGYKL
ncbi:ribosomal protein L28 [Chloropicon primus]|uniref:Large ribosomal subunit protein bL28c n=1 Tax=Chloropicon primus TaxID=1764295 RepID=A0A5B8MQD7_9CHLO|nr:ribosomal protein L28 [Chloropicon primus]|eukprot:QDZ22571.1 ribosomal protein L28 [Chloropicon primus]